MASAYSILRNYGEYVQPFDFNLIQKGLEYKQQKYDANSAMIQSQIDQFASLQLAKGEDQEYLNERLNTLVDQVNEFGSIDLSSNGVTRNIQNHVKQVLDENVMNAYTGTKNLQKYQQEVAFYKKEKPEGYSQVNEMYGMQSAIKWLNDGQAGTTYKGSTYTPFTDVPAQKAEILESMYKNSESTFDTIEYREVDGQLVPQKVTKSFKGLSSQEIASTFEGNLSPQDIKQMEINSWANFESHPENTMRIFNQYTTGRLKELDAEMTKYKNTDTAKYQMLKGQKETLESNVTRLKENYNKNPDGTIGSIGFMLEKENVLGGLRNRFLRKQTKYKFQEDTTYWKLQNHKLANAKLAIKANKQATLAPSGVSSNISAFSEGTSTNSQKVNAIDLLDEGITTTRNSVYKNALKLLDTDLKSAKSEIELTRDNIVSENPDVTPEQALITATDRYLNENELSKSVDVDTFQINFNKYKDGVEYKTETYDKVKADLDTTIKEQMYLVAEEGNINFREKYNKVLSFNLITDSEFENGVSGVKFGDLTETQKNEMEKVVLSDIINTRLSDADEDGLSYLTDLLADKFEEEGSYKADKVVYEARDGQGGTVQKQRVITTFRGGEKTKQFLDKTKDLGIRNSVNILQRDNSILEDATFQNAFNGTIGEYIKRETQAEITPDILERLGRTNLTISPEIVKGVPKRSTEQEAAFISVEQALVDKDTKFLQDGDLTNIAELSTSQQKLLDKLKLDNNFRPTIKVDSGIDNDMSLVTVNNQVSLLVRTDILQKNFGEIGVDLNREILKRDKVFFNKKIERNKKVTPIDENTFEDNKEYYQNTLMNLSNQAQDRNVFTTLTPNTSLETLSTSLPVSPEDLALASKIFNKKEIDTKLELKGNSVKFKIVGDNGKDAYTTNQVFNSVQDAQKYYSIMDNIYRVNPNYFIYNAVQHTLEQKRTKKIPTHTLEGISKNLNL